jgi:hypothetical protein
MAQPLVSIHERLGQWARQLRPRFPADSVRWSESRSTASFVAAARLSACPILVVDLGDRSLEGLEALGEAMIEAPSALALVLCPQPNEDVEVMARELGATLVLSGVTVPPVVEMLLRRWIPLAKRRMASAGWSQIFESGNRESVF